MKELGLRLNARKVCFFSTENHFSGCGVGSDNDAGTYVPCSDRVNPHVSQESKRSPVTHCQSVSKTAGSDISCVQRDTFWPAVHETPTVVAQDQGVLFEGKTPSHDQGHSWLFCSLAIAMLFHTRQGFASLAAWISRSPSVFDAARVPGGERPR